MPTFAILIVSLLFGGCATAHIEPVLTRRPLVQTLPLTIGVYFSPEFCAYRSKCDAWLCPEYEIGQPSVALFELLLAGFFKDVVILDANPPAQSTPKLDGILVPEIITFRQDRDRQLVEVSYRILIYSTTGNEYGAWDVHGSTWGVLGERIRLAMRQAAANFVTGFREQSVVKTWLKQLGIETPASAPRELSPRMDVG